jgi:hypothetical protein
MSKEHPKEIQEWMITMFKDGSSATEIAKQIGLHTTSVTRVLKRNGLKMSDGKGKNHSGWKGGRGLKSGYWTVYCPEHPRAMNTRRVYEHILVAEKKYKRFIKKGEPIHHIDFDRQNNKPSNLYLCKNHQEHQTLHYSLEEVARELFRQGKLGFKKGKYYWK